MTNGKYVKNMTRKSLERVGFAAAFSFLARAGFCWGPVGHRVVGVIAQDRLTPQALAAVESILGQNRQGSSASLEDIANCPDDVKYGKGSSLSCAGAFSMSAGEQTAFGPVAIPWKESAPWHFMNVPNSASPAAGNIEQYCPDNSNGNPAKDCVTAQIKYDLKILESPQYSQSDRQLALMFLVHFVGDEHQPLHINDDNDWGGNKKKVVFEGSQMNLHALWDNIIEPRYDYKTESPQGEIADSASLAAKLEQDLGNHDIGSWTASSDLPDQAAVESFYIAKNVIRPSYAQSYDPSQNAAIFGADYQKTMQPIAYLQLEKAGVRLAYLLNNALGSQAAGSAARAKAANVLPPVKAADSPFAVPWDGQSLR
ncbi:MAG: S1/P1 nuclease [Elusimicrobiota bacterium]